MTAAFSSAMEAFRRDYGAHRAAEGRAHDSAELLSLPYLGTGPLARQWQVRARTFDAFVRHVLRSKARAAGRPLRIVDLGAGNGWLSCRMAREGHACTAVDVRDDAVDGLGAATPLLREAPFDCLIASFDNLPLPADAADIVVFNASLHYATDLATVLAEAARVIRPGGTVAILDSPFYARERDGQAMVAEKHATAHVRFGDRAGNLLALPCIEYLTRERLGRASSGLGLSWRRRRVRYPFWYELRPLIARLRRQRAPSRFDLWTAEAP